MIKTKFLLILLLSLYLFKGQAIVRLGETSISVGFGSGIATFHMPALKSLNRDLLRSLPFDAKIVSNMPPFLTYEAFVLMESSNFSIGPLISYRSTGSRISSTDYTGSYLFDLKLQSFNYGIKSSYQLFQSRKSSWLVYINAGFIFSKMSATEKFVLYEEMPSTETENFTSHNYFTEPGISYQFMVYKHYKVNLYAGVEIQLDQEKFKINSQFNSQAAFGPNWTGFRTGIALLF